MGNNDVLFVGGMIIAIMALCAQWLANRRREAYLLEQLEFSLSERNKLEDKYLDGGADLAAARLEITAVQELHTDIVKKTEAAVEALAQMTRNRDQFERERKTLADQVQILHRDFGETQHQLFEERVRLLARLKAAGVENPPINPTLDRMIAALGGAA